MKELLANRLNAITESQTLRMTKMARELRNNGVEIINLSIGEPDFDTPDHIKRAAIEAIESGFTKYPPVAGIPELREAISEKFRKENDLNYSPEQIIVSTGAKHTIMNVIMAMINPGDEVIIPAPYWVSYSEMVKLAGGLPRFIPSSIDNNYKPDFDYMKKLISPKTKLFLFSSPCNPSGTVFNHNDLEQIVNIVQAYEDIHIVSDEIYEHIQYEHKHLSIGSFDSIRDRVITVNGVSKSFAMTGWRIGYMGAPLWLANACEKLQGQFTSGANSIAQKATLAALTSSLAPTIEMKEAFKVRRDVIYQALSAIPGMKCNYPEGAFYVFPDVSNFFGKTFQGEKIKSSTDLALYLIREAHVSTVTGTAFGSPECLRISYAASTEEITKAVDLIAGALAKLEDGH